MDTFNRIFEVLLALGPGGALAAVFAYWAKLERDERRELSKSLLEIAINQTGAAKDVAKALEILSLRLTK